jgi:hypothetical protein
VRRSTAHVASIAVLASLFTPSGARADAGPAAMAGVAKIDASWHVGASAGQYASDGTPVGDHGVDPTTHSVRRAPSYGLQSRTWTRALVIQGSNGKRTAIVSNDLYIPQDFVNRRVGGLLAEYDRAVALGLEDGPATGITERNMTISVTHSHSSPYYSTPSWGVWTYQDVMDVRFFEYIAERMARAVIEASHAMVPVRMGAAVRYFDRLQKHSFGPQVADDGTPAGYPRTDVDRRVTVVRFDDVSQPVPAPLATWVILGLHPEFLDGNDLLSGEYVNTMYRVVDREVGGVTLFSQNDTGTSEAADDANAHAPAERAEYSHAEYAQMERGARLLADAVEGARDDVAGGADPQQERVPFSTRFPVDVSDIRFAPPSLRPSPVVSSCRTEQVFHGNPPVPVAGLPDCEFPLRGVADPVWSQLPFDPSVTWDAMRAAGVPVPDNIGFPSYTGLEETLQVHLQAIRLGGIGITVCPCEQWADQSRNIRSRLNTVPGDFWDGFDWTALRTPSGREWCIRNADTTWTCANPRNPARDLAPVSDYRYRRMLAQVHNDAKGWEDPSYAPYAETEPVQVELIKGNYTHEELTPFGYDMVITVGMSNDYWGYIATYREFQRGDHYRKALTGLGPHSSDFLATRLSRMAASLNGGPPVTPSPKDLAYAPEDVHERERANAFGVAVRTMLPLYEAILPADGGTPRVVDQPSDITRFSAARLRFVGGSNYFDLPDARVERLIDGAWTPYADGSGEVQLKVGYPQAQDMPVYRAGGFEWTWDATFEAFASDIEVPDASGVRRGITPEGTYRFVVDGVHHGTGSYHLESAAFLVHPWNGITAGDVRVEPGGVSFAVGPVSSYTFGTPNTYTVGPIDYPDTYDSPFRFVRDREHGDQNLRTYGPGVEDDQLFCFECSFRPWLDTGRVASAAVTVVRPDGSFELAQATPGPDGRWHASVDGCFSAFVDGGRIVDDYGQFNAEASNVVATC